MAQTSPIDPFDIDFSGVDAHRRPIYRRLSLLNGLLIGLALSLGAWGVELWRIARLPVAGYMPSLLLGAAVVIVLCSLVGWLTGRAANTPFTVILWGATAVAATLVLGYLPTYGRTLAVWLTEPPFRGRVVYPYTLEGTPTGMILSGLLLIVVLVILAVLQSYRLEQIAVETSQRGRLNGRAWLALLLPLPFVFLAGFATQNAMANPSSTAIALTHHALSVAQTHDGDLRMLELNDGISYAALQPVRDLIGGDYILNLVDMNPLNSTVIVGADFDSGAWVYCRVINDQLSFCYDASPAYTVGLRSLITGEPLPDECRGCALQSTAEAAAWLAERRARFGPDPRIERVAQQGSHVLMRITAPDGRAADCWIEGVTPTRLVECRDADEESMSVDQ